MKPKFSDLSDRTDHDRWDRTRFYLSDRSDQNSSKNLMDINFSDRKIKVNSVFSHHVSGAKLNNIIHHFMHLVFGLKFFSFLV